jgi:hypothetical protein
LPVSITRPVSTHATTTEIRTTTANSSKLTICSDPSDRHVFRSSAAEILRALRISHFGGTLLAGFFGAAGLVARHWMRTLRCRASLHSARPLWGGLRFKKPPTALPPLSRLEMYAAVVHPQLEAAEPRVVRQVPATQRHRILIRLGRESLDRFYSAGGTEQV